MNHIKTKAWFHNIGIISELFATNIYTQNCGIERFRRMIMKKAWVIKLLANQLYKL